MPPESSSMPDVIDAPDVVEAPVAVPVPVSSASSSERDLDVHAPTVRPRAARQHYCPKFTQQNYTREGR